MTDDACDVDLDATLVHIDGSTEPEPFVPAVDAPVDCFYVYPTISTDEGQNSDLVPGESERGVAAGQAARFGEVCNVYAPMYRQIPLGALMDRLSGAEDDGAADESSSGDEETGSPLGGTPGEIAYGDVREAFMHYLSEDNDGRPFVLIGHSQGAGHLAALVAQEIDGNEAIRSQLSSAMLIGGAVAASGDGAYENVAACDSPTDTGCVISYATFYEGEPPPPDSLFGRVRGVDDSRAICTNPADPAAEGAAALQSYFKAEHAEGAPVVDTPYIHYDGLVTGRCTSDDAFDWLEISRNTSADPGLPDDLGGRITPQWGAHLADVDFAIGDLINLVRSQNNLD
jgi:pimeloyl-ACP methyl ester carboxylesterase